jgi:hypothetical protein
MNALDKHEIAAGTEPTSRSSAEKYYSLIAHAVGGLPNHRAEARQELYERWRAWLADRVKGQDPPEAYSQIAALEAAIRRVEQHQVHRPPPLPNREPNASLREPPSTKTKELMMIAVTILLAMGITAVVFPSFARSSSVVFSFISSWF